MPFSRRNQLTPKVLLPGSGQTVTVRNMKEIIIYSIVAFSALFIMGYSVHMLVGGLVAAATERMLIIGVCALGIAVMSAMTWDVLKRRRGRR